MTLREVEARYPEECPVINVEDTIGIRTAYRHGVRTRKSSDARYMVDRYGALGERDRASDQT
jgi:hypothetical protein